MLKITLNFRYLILTLIIRNAANIMLEKQKDGVIEPKFIL